MSAVAEHQPDVTVVDIRMPPTHTDEGLRAAIEIRRDHPGTGVLLFSQYVETQYATRLLAGGAAGVGYLLKDRVAERHRVHRCAGPGGCRRHSARPGSGHPTGRRRTTHPGPRTVVRREREVLALMAEGRSNAGIAQALVVTDGTVEKHVASIFAKLGLPVSDDDNRRVLAVLRYLRN